MTNKARKALAYAEQQTSKPYVYGAKGPNAFDCSGLMQAAYKSAGINIPRTSQQQAGFGKPVSKSQLQPGDLVFPAPAYGGTGHVMMYAGDGRIVEAATPKKGIRETNLYSFGMGRRIDNDADDNGKTGSHKSGGSAAGHAAKAVGGKSKGAAKSAANGLPSRVPDTKWRTLAIAGVAGLGLFLIVKAKS